jgi:hypothetical protein
VGKRLRDLSSAELLEHVRTEQLDEGDALEVLRSPYCTPEIAERVADSRALLTSVAVRELLSGFRGFRFSRAMDLLATLPWTSLLNVAQSPSAPPVVRRQAEKRLLVLLPRLSLGEKIALARRVHRIIMRNLIALEDPQVLLALLDNPRVAENDVLLILNTCRPPPEVFAAVARHRKWGHYYGIRRALAECPQTPLPLALSALVQLRAADLRRVAQRPGVPASVRSAARALKEKDHKGLRRMIRSSGGDDIGAPDDPSESLR